MGRALLEHTDITITCHDEGTCYGEVCSIHKRSDHIMRGFPQHWRSDRGIMERTCPCHVGHPDFDDYKVINNPYEAVHGCCPQFHCSPREGQIVYHEGLEARRIVPGYYARIDGAILSYYRTLSVHHGNKTIVDLEGLPKVLRWGSNDKGYRTVHVGRRTVPSGKRKTEYIHRLVWEAWRGHPGRLQVRHWDGDPTNNHLHNLRIGTQKENEADKLRHGTLMQGEGHANSKLTAGLVAASRQLFKRGHSLEAIKEHLNLSTHKASLHEAIIGQTWASVNSVEGPATKGVSYRTNYHGDPL